MLATQSETHFASEPSVFCIATIAWHFFVAHPVYLQGGCYVRSTISYKALYIAHVVHCDGLDLLNIFISSSWVSLDRKAASLYVCLSSYGFPCNQSVSTRALAIILDKSLSSYDSALKATPFARGASVCLPTLPLKSMVFPGSPTSPRLLGRDPPALSLAAHLVILCQLQNRLHSLMSPCIYIV